MKKMRASSWSFHFFQSWRTKMDTCIVISHMIISLSCFEHSVPFVFAFLVSSIQLSHGYEIYWSTCIHLASRSRSSPFDTFFFFKANFIKQSQRRCWANALSTPSINTRSINQPIRVHDPAWFHTESPPKSRQ